MITSKNVMIAKYNANRKNDYYIIGFVYDDNVYMYVTKQLIHKSLYTDNGNLRMHYTKEIKEKVLKSKKCKFFCSLDELITFIDKANRCNSLGEAFEKATTEYYGKKWEKDWIPYYQGCDLYVNGKGISIKLASHCTIARQKSFYK